MSKVLSQLGLHYKYDTIVASLFRSSHIASSAIICNQTLQKNQNNKLFHCVTHKGQQKQHIVLKVSKNIHLEMNKLFKRTDHATRSASIMEEKERFLSMTKEEKREKYKCRDRYNTLDDVPTWPEYYKENKEKLIKKVKDKEPFYPVNAEINKQVSIWRGDITTLEIDSICNAANNSLLGGGGVDGAIHNAAGSQLKAECATLGGCDTGDAKITCGYKLPAKYVIHTVGPIGEKKMALMGCYGKCLEHVSKNNLNATAFPCISTGIYGYDSAKAAPVAIGTVRDWLESPNKPKEFSRVIFCLFMPKDVAIYEELMQLYFPVSEDEEDSGQKAQEEKATNAEAVKLEESPKSKADKEETPKSDASTEKDAKSDANTEEDAKLEASAKLSEQEAVEETQETAVKEDEEVDLDVKAMDSKAGEMDLKSKDSSDEKTSPSRSPQAKRKQVEKTTA